jgi:ABC-type antimicrobial peptide transport system permease subunit
MSGAVVGAIVGLLIGIGLSIYVARLDYKKRVEGVRTQAQYRLSLFGVPIILALIGALVGGLIAH